MYKRQVGDRQGIASTLNNLAQFTGQRGDTAVASAMFHELSLIHISEPTRLLSSSYAVFCVKKKNTKQEKPKLSTRIPELYDQR